MAAAEAAAWRRVALVAVLALPWLWPFSPGPSPNVQPVLVAWCCVAIAFVLAAGGEVAPHRVVARSWLLAAGASSIIGLLQWFGAAPATSWIHPSEVTQAYGNLRQRNQFATLTAIGLAVLVWCPPSSRRSWMLPAVALLAAANAASASRTGLLAWAVLLALAATWPGPRRERVLWCAVGLGLHAAASFLLPWLLLHWREVEVANVFDRTAAELGCSSRKVLWSNVVHLVLQRPWTGWGWGELDFAHFATLYPGARFCDILDNAHNLPLHLAVELGIPATLLVAAVVLSVLRRAAPWREADPVRQLAWAVLLVIGLHSLVEYPLWYGPFQVAVLLCCVLLAPQWARLRPVAALAGAALVVVAAGLVWVDYQRVSQAFLPPAQRWSEYRMDPVGRAGRSLLFDPQLRFAELSVVSLTPANAAHVQRLAREALHHSPEPLVAERLIESSLVLGDDDLVTWAAARYRAAFPVAYRTWLQRHGMPAQP